MNNITLNEQHQYFVDGNRKLGVNEIIGLAMPSLKVDFDRLVGVKTMVKATTLGNKIHKTTALYDQNQLNMEKLHPKLNEYLSQWIIFQAEMDNLTFNLIEEPLYSPRYNFVGTTDRAGFVGKGDKTQPCIIDIKTGSSIPPSAKLQTAGYAVLFAEQLKVPPTDIIRYVVRITQKDFKLETHRDMQDIIVFQSCVNIANWLHTVQEG